MQNIAIRTATQPIATNRWLRPAFLWESTDTDAARPFLAEFGSDQFLADFLAMMRQELPLNLPPPQDMDTAGTYKLYQPFHQRYYLVMGSLVCRQFGLPDHTVVRKNGERTSFVLRRRVNGQELAWVNDGPNKGWQPLLDEKNRPVTLRCDEQRLPLHQMQTELRAPIDPASHELRIIYYGYIPVSSREKYLDVTADITGDIQSAVAAGTVPDPRLDEISTRVIEAWRTLLSDSFKVTTAEQQRQFALYLILDLGDCLQRYLPDVFNALGNKGATLAGWPNCTQLLAELQNIYMPLNGNAEVTLADAVFHFRDSLSLAQGLADLPADNYQLNAAYKKNNDGTHALIQLPPYSSYLNLPPTETDPLDGNGDLHKFFRLALQEEPFHLYIPDNLKSLFKNEPQGNDSYCARLVYEHAPCCPVVSEPCAPFVCAKYFDPDAPARAVRIELPDITFRELRRFKRGVGIQMSPRLNAVMNRVNTNMLTGGTLSPGPELSVMMICTFSIPIITLLAFIVMFIFLLLFNIIFWWLPFIRWCFPLPLRKR